MKKRILQEGRNCWKTVDFSRLSVLVDAASFYEQFAKVAEEAQESILIVAWDVDWRTRLIENKDETFAEFALRLVNRNPRLEINVLEWDFAMIYAFERGILPMFGIGIPSHHRIHHFKDALHPLAASHHQKVAVIDNCIAFCGGLDITRRRWDTTQHLPDDPRRIDPDNVSYGPYHDAQVMVEGDAAKYLGKLARDRWKKATGKESKSPKSRKLRWPKDLKPDLVNSRLSISRTEPPLSPADGIHEIENLIVDMVHASNRWLYIETQYLTAARLETALDQSLRRHDGPEIIIVVPRDCSGWLEENTLGYLRVRMINRLKSDDHYGRLRVYYPLVDETPVLVHSKIVVADDNVITIGSANLNNRSMGLDTECNLSVESGGDRKIQKAIGNIRNRLVGEHIGFHSDDVQRFLKSNGSLIALIDSRKNHTRHLGILETPNFDLISSALQDRDLVDPERPIQLEQWVNDFVPNYDEKKQTGAQILRTGLIFAGIVLLAAVWYSTPLRQYLNPAMLAENASEFSDSPFAPLAVIVGYVLGSLLLFPITVLILSTVLLFGSTLGFGYSLLGATVASAVTYWIGRLLKRNDIRKKAGTKLNRISRLFAKKGVLAVVIARLLPIAPFAIVNLVAGASHIRFWDFMIGSIIGMLPGLFGMIVFEKSLKAAITDPDAVSVMTLAAVIAALLILAAVVQNRLGKKQTEIKQVQHASG